MPRTTEREGRPYIVTYCDVIHAKSNEDAYRILLRQLSSDVNCQDVSAFNFKPLEELRQ